MRQTTSSTASASSTTAQGQATPTSTASFDTQTANSPTNNNDSPAKSSGLPTAGKIGLAIGMAIIAVVLMAGIIVFCSNRKRKLNLKGAAQDAPEVYMGNPEGTSPLPMQMTSSRTALNYRLNGTTPKPAELEGGKGPVQKIRALHRSLHEMSGAG
jgi:hypothetical protein